MPFGLVVKNASNNSFGVLGSDSRSGILDTNKDSILEMFGTHTEDMRTICDEAIASIAFEASLIAPAGAALDRLALG